MRYESYALEVPSAPGYGAVHNGAEDLVDKNVYITGYTGGTFRLWGSADGTHWTQLGANIGANGLRSLPEAVKQLKAQCAVAGTASITVVGRQSRSDGTG